MVTAQEDPARDAYERPRFRALLGSSARIEVRVVGAGAKWERWPWARAAHEIAFEQLSPVRGFPVRHGRRVAPGWWWSATTGKLVHYGFGAMRTQVMLLDQDPQVVALACSPLELAWAGDDGTPTIHAPHLMARLRDGSGLLVDCAGRQGPSRRLAAHAASMAAVAEAVGWHYRIAPVPDPVRAANVRWLSGYRHSRNACGDRLAQVAVCFARPRPLVEGVRELGDPIAVWPAVFHALWCGILQAPLDSPLHERAIAVSAGAGKATA
jgi:hypothetical protein